MAENQEFDATIKELASLVGNAWDAAGGFDKELRRLLQQFQPEEVLTVVRGLAERGESLLVDPPAYNVPSPQPHRPQDYAATDDYEQQCLESALAAIPVADLTRDQWVRVGMALKDAGQDVYTWDSWSQADTRYHQGECQRLWAGFRRDGVTKASIYAMAQERGWTQPPRPRPQYQEPQAPWPTDADAPVYGYQGYTEAVVNNVQMSLRPENFSDTGFMRLFQRVYANKLVYCKLLGWLQWDGCRWVAGDHFGLKAATQLAEMMLADAQGERRRTTNNLLDAKDDADWNNADGTQQRTADAKSQNGNAKQYVAFARKCLGARQQKACLELAIPQMTVPALALDADGWLLNTPSGVIDLHTGDVRPNAPEYLCTKTTRCGPGDQGAETWEAFLDQVTDGDKDLQRYMQLVVGMCCIGEVNEQTLILVYGGGSNGKSTMFNAIADVLGDYSKGISTDAIIAGKGNVLNHLADLRGCRLAIGGELENGMSLSSSSLKKIASTDVVKVEAKFHQPDDVKPSHHVVLYTNVLPKITATDKGTWSRLQVIPFLHTIERKDAVMNFGDVLVRDAGPAILNWAVQGAVKFYQSDRKLDPPTAVQKATESYRAREDQVANFLQEICLKDQARKTKATDLYDSYRGWCSDVGERDVKTKQAFNSDMAAKGYKRQKSGGNIYWKGLAIDWDGRLRDRNPSADLVDVASYKPPQDEGQTQCKMEELPF